MLMTHFGILDATKTKPGLIDRCAHALQCLFGLAESDRAVDPGDRHTTAPAITPERSTEPLLRVVHVQPEIIRAAGGLKWRRHPQLLRQVEDEQVSDQRGARHDAVRGLYAARAGALDVAVEQFTRAARCPEIDLSHIPGFWQLSRSAMTTAVDAYEAVGRIRDASALNARIRTMYRPRALTPVPANVTHLPERPNRISSNS